MSESVKVIVRCRPLNGKEREMNMRVVIEANSITHQCSIKKPGNDPKLSKTFTFDRVYGISSSTEVIYSEIVRPIVNGVVEGYNGTVFAYGQTSCGKTFTMDGIQTPSAQKGIIPRCCEHVLSSTRQRSLERHDKYLLRVSYLEIYNEEIRDLLVKDYRYKPEIKERPDKGIYVKGLSSITVDSYEDMKDILKSGSKNRSVGSTLMNTDSSRSHSIFTIDLEACLRSGPDKKEVYRTGKLNLVDLAGSERQSKSGCAGERFKESTKINLSLSVLGNVISSLVDSRCTHVPYRDSKLTRLLQDSLGGNSKTLMIACISPGENNYEETLSTLRYAARAKNIKNKPKINEDPKDTIIKKYHDEIQQLKRIIAKEIPVPSRLVTELREVREESNSTSLTYGSTLTKRYEEEENGHTYLSSQISVKAIEAQRIESQKLHVKVCQETASLKRELEDVKAQLKLQQRRLEFEARKSVLEEHKTALMLLRGRRIVDGGCALGRRKATDNDQVHFLSSELRETPSSEDLLGEVTSSDVKRFPSYSPLRVEKADLDFERVETEATSVTKVKPEREVNRVPKRPLMISVATSTDDLDELAMETNAELNSENEQEMEEKDWNIQENMLCREVAEGRSRSVSPDTAEKKSFANGQIVYSLDEEGPVNFGLCCLCPEKSFFGERLEEFFGHKLKHS